MTPTLLAASFAVTLAPINISRLCDGFLYFTLGGAVVAVGWLTLILLVFLAFRKPRA